MNDVGMGIVSETPTLHDDGTERVRAVYGGFGEPTHHCTPFGTCRRP
jgi:hypothetical protein